MTETHTVEIPRGIYDGCRDRISETTFETVDEYVTFVLTVIIDEDPSTSPMSEEMSIDEEQLEALGYLGS